MVSEIRIHDTPVGCVDTRATPHVFATAKGTECRVTLLARQTWKSRITSGAHTPNIPQKVPHYRKVPSIPDHTT